MTFSSVLLPQPEGPEDRGEMFFRKARGHLGQQQLIVGRVSKLEGDILEFEHGAQSVVD